MLHKVVALAGAGTAIAKSAKALPAAEQEALRQMMLRAIGRGMANLPDSGPTDQNILPYDYPALEGARITRAYP
jgi:hypothetical protein